MRENTCTAEKFLGVLVDTKFTVSSNVPLQERGPTAYWIALGSVATTMTEVIILLYSALVRLHLGTCVQSHTSQNKRDMDTLKQVQWMVVKKEQDVQSS